MKFLSLLKSSLVILLLSVLLWCSLGAVAAQADAEIGLFEDLEVQPDRAFEVPISIRNVDELYAVDVEIRFDPAVVQVSDAAPNQAGIQVGLGTFLDAGLILYNEADNEEGVIRFAMTQINPSEPKSGEGVVLVLYLASQGEGETSLEVTLADGSDRGGNAIPLTGVAGEIRVLGGAAEVAATEIPVQDVAQVTVIPTMAATAIPTPTPTLEPTAIPEIAEETAPEETAPEEMEPGYPGGEPVEDGAEEVESVEENAHQLPEAEAQKTIVDYWWVVLIVVLAAGGLAAYLLLGKGKTI